MNDKEPQITTEDSADTETAVERATPRNRRRRSTSTELSVNMGELREIIELIRENDFSEFELEREGFRVRFRRGGVAAQAFDSAPPAMPAAGANRPAQETATPAPVHPGTKAQAAASEDQDLHIIPSPIVGTFYRSPSPNADSFVKIGSRVEPDTVVCIIEAMKLMNEIQAEASGEVAKIYVENGQPVEYGQPLFGIKK
ncbi:MAG TPA: acetyl-CoA carboxylase biotin carboxyl carrier protein [Pyrinomonadaceae bacterium]|nr:acetyl-CoA carboxylase biotin carboxyl carrier protein [Pyrinomonadaceae bacterium]